MVLEGKWHLSQGPGAQRGGKLVANWGRTIRNLSFLENPAVFELHIHLLLLKKHTAALCLHLLFNSFMLLVGNTIVKVLLGQSLL